MSDISNDTSSADKIYYDYSYQYSPLKSKTSFRLLNLKAGRKDDRTLTCDIIEVSLDDPPYYEALSYAWDAQYRNKRIECSDLRIPITGNCEAALRRLVRSWSNRLIFVDAVCIDQCSPYERNHQVQLMGSIYKKASRVVVWLGQGTKESDRALKFLTNVARMKGVNEKSIISLATKFDGTYVDYYLIYSTNNF
jgi:hypothetical protein